MDNDILLTRHSPELQWAADKKLLRDNNFVTYNDAMDMCEEACRAQTKRIYQFIRTHWIHASVVTPGATILTIKHDDWEALRKAAGGD